MVARGPFALKGGALDGKGPAASSGVADLDGAGFDVVVGARLAGGAVQVLGAAGGGGLVVLAGVAWLLAGAALAGGPCKSASGMACCVGGGGLDKTDEVFFSG